MFAPDGTALQGAERRMDRRSAGDRWKFESNGAPIDPALLEMERRMGRRSRFLQPVE